jgi:hypothetical protein
LRRRPPPLALPTYGVGLILAASGLKNVPQHNYLTAVKNFEEFPQLTH